MSVRWTKKSLVSWHASGRFSAPIGASVYPGDVTTPDGLLQHADIALYVSKSASKARLSHRGNMMPAALLAGFDKPAPTGS